jgi:hypothetical protein
MFLKILKNKHVNTREKILPLAFLLRLLLDALLDKNHHEKDFVRLPTVVQCVKVTLTALLQLVDVLLAHILVIAWQHLLEVLLVLKALMEADFALVLLHVGPDVTIIAWLHRKVVPL